MPNMFLARLSITGVKESKYWNDSKYIGGLDRGLGLPNCTFYTVGREGESTDATGKLKLFKNKDAGGFPNAKEFYTQWAGSKGIEPKLGSIVCWGSSKDQYGHVAFIEKEPIKLATNKWQITVSESCWASNPSKGVYWRLKDYVIEPGKVTSGVGYVYNGCCYNIKNNDFRVNRDTNKNQVAVLIDNLCARKSPNGEKWSGLYAVKGVYNILSTKEAGGYTWASLSNDCWIALNDKEGWTATYLLPTDSDKDKKIADLEKQVKALNTDLTSLKDKLNKAKEILKG